MADEVTIKGSQLTGYENEGGVTVDGFTFIGLKNSNSNAPTVNSKSFDARMYANNSLTIKSSSGNITKLVFNISTQGLKRLAPITASVGAIATQASGDKTVTWTGEASEITLTVGEKANYGTDGETKAGQFDFDDVIITTGEGGGSTVTVKTPEIIGTTPFTESTQVSISGPDGGSTYYTTDGSTPSKTNGTVYTAPFTLTETTTVKAIGYDEDDNASSVAEKTFTKESEISVSTLKEFIDLADNTKVTLTLTNAQVLGAGNSNIVIKDATGSILIFDKNLNLEKGQIVNGTLKGIKTTYGGLPEIKSISESSLSTEAGTLTNKTVTPEQMIADDYITFSYKLENVECAKPEGNSNYYFTAGEKSIQIRDQFKIGNVTADGKYNLVGLLGVYNDNVQFWPTEVPEAAQAITYPEAANIAAVKEFEEGTTVKLTLKDAVVNYVNGTRDIFAEDATGAIDLFQLGIEAKAGDVLNGTIIVQYKPYNNLPEVVAVSGLTVASDITVTEGTAPTPKEMTIADAVKIENACKLVTIKNITLVKDGDNYFADAEKTLQVFDKFKVNYTPNTESAMDYTGILIPFKEQFQICPTVEPTASQGGETPATPEMIAFTDGDTAGDGAVFSKGDFKLTQVDTDGKTAIDGNNVYFGTADNYQKFTHRLKTGGKSGSKNSLTLTIPSDGTLNVYVRTGSNTATDRNLVLTQDGTELYNQVVQEADAITVTMGENDNKVYPVITVNVKAGEVAVGYPTGSLNFYGFEFIAGASGVNAVIVEKAKNNIRYNLAGQRVDENYKGVVIMNGKKFVVK